MWQKARITHVERIEDSPAIGRIVWVKGPTELCNDPYCLWCEANGRQLIYRETSLGQYLAASMLELLPEFTERVDTVSWKDFLAQERL